jgi:ABC-type polysaccharide/polyol phosphate transport system ATPase subunit
MISPTKSEAAPETGLEPGADASIVIEHVSVRYRVPLDPALTLKEYAIRRLTGRVRYVDHDALQDVSVTVGRGDAMGVIGPNGAGKTTLLRLVARVLSPTSGRVRVRGRVAPILDLVGAFHPELTGRENIFLNGTLLGLSRRDIAARFDRIVQFAELDAFIDAPVRTYSSGMVARLGFAVASDVDPEILVIDETLGVGDERFQVKCAARLDDFRRHGTTLLLVSHDMHSIVRLCSRAIWIDRGRLRLAGSAADVSAAYLAAQHP